VTAPPTNRLADPADVALAGRARFVGFVMLAVSLLLWAAWFYPFHGPTDRSGQPIGADFPVFYVAGRNGPGRPRRRIA